MKNKLFSILLTLSLIICFVPYSLVEAKTTKKTKLSNTNITITQGNKKTISLKNYSKLSKKQIKNVKWTSSNKKVVTTKTSGKYKQKCTLYAKNKGKAIIKVKYNDKTYKCSVKVIEKPNSSESYTTEESITTEHTTETPTKHEHKFGEWIVTKNATCENTGLEERSCECGEKEARIIKSEGHSYINHICVKCNNIDTTNVYSIVDVSEQQNKGIMCYIFKNSDDTYNLYIKSENDNATLKTTERLTKETTTFSATDILSKSIKNIYFVNKIKLGEDASSLFYECCNMIDSNIDMLDTSNVKNMKDMFGNCNNITSLNLINFNTSNTTSMNSMFFGCNSLKFIDLSTFNTSNVTDMSWMFCACYTLTDLDLKTFNTSNVTNMSCMFTSCENLINVNIKSFNTEKVKNMGRMFSFCSNLTKLDLNNFNTSNVSDMHLMFSRCEKLNELNIKSFNTTKVKTFEQMFFCCESLKNLNLKSFDVKNATNMNSMFYGCTNLNSINVTKGNWIISDNCDINNMFYRCKCSDVTIN